MEQLVYIHATATSSQNATFAYMVNISLIVGALAI